MKNQLTPDNDIKQRAIDNILEYDSVEACELHHELYNLDYFIIGTHRAKEAMGNDAFDIIGEVQEYEKDNFGEVTTDLSCPEKVLNMYAYIIGEEFLQESETLQSKWNKTLEYSDLEKIKEELEELI